MKEKIKTKAEKRSEGLLQPCPFCGGQARLKKHNKMIDTWYVQCHTCGIRTPYSTKAAFERWENAKNRPVEQWNRRVKV